MLKPMSAIAFAALILVVGGSVRAGNPPSPLAVAHAPNWVNGAISQRDLTGKVVLVDFYTFNCINCKHTEPNLRRLYHETSRHDLVIVGVHTPETSYESNRDNLLASLKDQGIAWPVAVDNDNTIWNEYGIQAWPTQLVFDRHGKLRATVVGEGQDDQIDKTIHELIAER